MPIISFFARNARVTEITITDAMVDACYNHPDKVPAAAKLSMRDAIGRALQAGGYEVVQNISPTK